MKTKLPFKTALHIALEGRLLTKVLTVFLCAFSFALVALASTGVFYDQADFLTRAFLYYMDSTRPALVFAWFDPEAQERILPSKWVERIQEETGLDFVASHGGMFIEPTGPFFYGPNVRRSDLAVSGTPQAYRDCGVKLLAGKFPEAVDEVAIELAQFEDFQSCGYAYNIHKYVYIKDGVLHTDLPFEFDEEKQYYKYHYGGASYSIDVDEEGWFLAEADSAEKQKIETYEDIIGKEFVFFGNPATGSLGNESLYTVKITGVVDVSEGYFNEYGQHGGYILHSAAWRETFWPSLKDEVVNLAQAPTDDYDLARKCVELSLEMVDEFLEIYPDHDEYDVNLGVYPITDFVDITTITSYTFWGHKNSFIFIGAVAGGFFGIFAVLLCWHQMTSMLAVQRIKIGILRSLGAGEKDVVKIVLLFAAILSFFTFLLAIGFTLAGYYGFLYPAFYTPKYGVSEFVLNGWNFLVLAGLSFGVPILCSLVPLRKFLKKSIVDNISGNIRAR